MHDRELLDTLTGLPAEVYAGKGYRATRAASILAATASTRLENVDSHLGCRIAFRMGGAGK